MASSLHLTRLLISIRRISAELLRGPTMHGSWTFTRPGADTVCDLRQCTRRLDATLKVCKHRSVTFVLLSQFQFVFGGASRDSERVVQCMGAVGLEGARPRTTTHDHARPRTTTNDHLWQMFRVLRNEQCTPYERFRTVRHPKLMKLNVWSIRRLPYL